MWFRGPGGRQVDSLPGRAPGGEPTARRPAWIAAARIAGIAAAGGLVVTWFAVAAGTRQIAAEQAPTVRRPPAGVLESLPAGLGEGAARLRERLRAAPRPLESARNPFRLAVVADPEALPQRIAPGFRSEPRREARAVASAGFTLIGIATTESREGPERTAVLLWRGDVVLARPGQPLGGGWTLELVEDDNVTLRHAAGDVRRMTLP